MRPRALGAGGLVPQARTASLNGVWSGRSLILRGEEHASVLGSAWPVAGCPGAISLQCWMAPAALRGGLALPRGTPQPDAAGGASVGSAVVAVFPCQGPGESLCGVWKHGAASEEGGRLPQQRHVIPVLGEQYCVSAPSRGRRGPPRAETACPSSLCWFFLLLYHVLYMSFRPQKFSLIYLLWQQTYVSS